jgi:hypothetical protein
LTGRRGQAGTEDRTPMEKDVSPGSPQAVGVKLGCGRGRLTAGAAGD